MIDFPSLQSHVLSFVCVYRKIEVGADLLHELCQNPLWARHLLKEQKKLSHGGSISFYPLEADVLLLVVRGKSYRVSHACAEALEELLMKEKQSFKGIHIFF